MSRDCAEIAIAIGGKYWLVAPTLSLGLLALLLGLLRLSFKRMLYINVHQKATFLPLRVESSEYHGIIAALKAAKWAPSWILSLMGGSGCGRSPWWKSFVCVAGDNQTAFLPGRGTRAVTMEDRSCMGIGQMLRSHLLQLRVKTVLKHSSNDVCPDGVRMQWDTTARFVPGYSDCYDNPLQSIERAVKQNLLVSGVNNGHKVTYRADYSCLRPMGQTLRQVSRSTEAGRMTRVCKVKHVAVFVSHACLAY